MIPDAGSATALVASLPMSDALRALCGRGEPRRFARSTLLIQEGDAGDTIFVILAGRLQVFSRDVQGRELVHGIYGPGEYLGEMSLDGGLRSASVVTLEPCTCVMVTRQTLRDHIAADPEFAFELLAKVIRRARSATLTAKHLALNDVYGRLVALLDQLSTPDLAGGRSIAGRPTHREMAARLGCSREMVSRLLKDLERGRYLLPRDGGWHLPAPLPQRW
jgi:CRP/FNR family cyclic AMP-dependent transcriptional regulator